jgi:endonuclease/exonuclease/phosphatase family metal-dependent hydrolase
MRAACAAVAAVFAVGCGGAQEDLATAQSAVREDLPAAGASGITLMTQNLYVGADVETLYTTPAPFIPYAVGLAFDAVQATNFPLRAQRIADEVEASNPDVIALQEVSLIRTQTPGDALFGNPVAASPEAHNYSVDFSFPFGGPGGPLVTVRRGWVAADVTVGARTVRVVNTHLEDNANAALAQVQTAQAAELLASVADETLPTILIGDFNSPAAGSTTPTYGMLVDAGFVDAWAQAHPRDPGYTCCQEADLLNATSQLSDRRDLVMVRQPNDPGRILGGVAATLVGNEPSDKTSTGLWPSDHAGVVSLLRLARGLPWAER